PPQSLLTPLPYTTLFRSPTYNSNRHWKFKSSDQVTMCIALPSTHRAITPLPSDICMCPRFNCTPVISCSDDNRVNPVHDPFIMGCCPVRIGICNLIGSDHPIDHIFA